MLDAGQVVERGTHDELVRAAGRYAELLSGAAVDGAAALPEPESLVG